MHRRNWGSTNRAWNPSNRTPPAEEWGMGRSCVCVYVCSGRGLKHSRSHSPVQWVTPNNKRSEVTINKCLYSHTWKRKIRRGGGVCVGGLGWVRVRRGERGRCEAGSDSCRLVQNPGGGEHFFHVNEPIDQKNLIKNLFEPSIWTSMYTQWAARGEPYTMIVLRVRGAQEPCVPSIAPSKPPVTSPSHPHSPAQTPDLPPSQLAIKNSVGGRGAPRAKNCAVAFLQLLMFRFQAAPTWFLLFKTSDRLCAKTHNPANSYRRKKKKNWAGRVGGGWTREGGYYRTAFPSVPCRVSAFSTGRKRTVRPHLQTPLSSGGLSLSGGYDEFKDRHPVGRVAKEDFSEPCCCFGPRFVSSERSF